MIKLIATDLDDTLLNEEWEISSGNAQAIRQAVAEGIKVTLATGRMAISARKYARELGLDVPIIAYHGALIQQPLSGEILYRQVIPAGLAAEIMENLAKKEIYAQACLKDRVFTPIANQYSEAHEKMTGIAVEEANISEILAKEPEGLEKILCIGEEEALIRAAGQLKLVYSEKLHFTFSKRNYLEIVDKEVNKGTALQALADGWGFRAEEVMAFGDNLNDWEMINYAGIGVAVENAHPEIKKIADYITSSNREDGVAKAIERFVLAKTC